MNAVPVNNNVHHVVLEDGFEIDVQMSAFNDYEMLEDLALTGSDGGERLLAMMRVNQKLFLPEDKQRLLDHIRNDNGIVTIDAMSDIVGQIFKAINDEKTKK